jgi:hypothetical protein
VEALLDKTVVAGGIGGDVLHGNKSGIGVAQGGAGTVEASPSTASDSCAKETLDSDHARGFAVEVGSGSGSGSGTSGSSTSDSGGVHVQGTVGIDLVEALEPVLGRCVSYLMSQRQLHAKNVDLFLPPLQNQTPFLSTWRFALLASAVGITQFFRRKEPTSCLLGLIAVSSGREEK